MKNKFVTGVLTAAAVAVFAAGCGNAASESGDKTVQQDTQDNGVASTGDQGKSENGADDPAQETEVQVFIAASLNTVMTDLAEQYKQIHPEITIVYNADSSGTLLTQIQEGYACDLFFSAAQKQMDQLDADGLLVAGSRSNVVNNQVVVVTRKGSGTKVTGLADLGKAESLALADGSVPVGKYTRQALINLDLLEKADDPAQITTQQVSQALGGVEISEQANVSKVLAAVLEGSCEVGTTYYSDTYGYEEELEILETVGSDLTGNVIYPLALVENEEADGAQQNAAKEFADYLLSEEAKEVFRSYYFDTDVSIR